MTSSLQSLLLAMVLVTSLASAGCLLTWLQDRRQKAVLWTGLSAIIACVAILARIELPLYAGIVIATPLLLVSFGLIWTGFRALQDHVAEPGVVILPVLIWLGLCFSPNFITHMDLRIGLGLLLALIPISLATRELWTMRAVSRYIRLPLLGMLVLQMLLMTRRAAVSLIWPHVTQAPLDKVPGFAILMVDILTIMLTLSVSMINLVKDKALREQYSNARSDVLTGIGNRWYFEEIFPRFFRRAVIDRQPLALIMVDADGFKAYNDAHGHLEGDRCLRQLAGALMSACRPNDLVARYGGDEFSIILPGTDYKSAKIVAERILGQVRSLRLKYPAESGGGMSISLGVAAYEPPYGPASPEALLEMADKALYQAKREGRDKVC